MAHMKEASRRWMYRGKRRNQVAKLLNRVDATAAAAGIGPKRLARLEVRGRRTGRRLSLPVVIAEHEGQRYLVAMLGTELPRGCSGRARSLPCRSARFTGAVRADRRAIPRVPYLHRVDGVNERGDIGVAGCG